MPCSLLVYSSLIIVLKFILISHIETVGFGYLIGSRTTFSLEGVVLYGTSARSGLQQLPSGWRNIGPMISRRFNDDGTYTIEKSYYQLKEAH